MTASSESRLFAYRIELDEQEEDDDEARNKKETAVTQVSLSK